MKPSHANNANKLNESEFNELNKNQNRLSTGGNLIDT